MKNIYKFLREKTAKITVNENVVTIEREDGQTAIYRLYAKDLCDWYSRDLKCYRLCKETESLVGVTNKADFLALKEV